MDVESKGVQALASLHPRGAANRKLVPALAAGGSLRTVPEARVRGHGSYWRGDPRAL